MSTEAEKLAAAMKAVRHILGRIADDHKVAYLMGHCTESYELLCQAVAVERGYTKADVEKSYPPCPQPGTSPATERASLVTMDIHQLRTCEVLNVAPWIASLLLAFARRRGTPLQAWYRDGDDDGRLNFADKAETIYRAWCERRQRTDHVELAA